MTHARAARTKAQPRSPDKSAAVEEVFQAVAEKRDRLVALLRDLIRIPTVVPPGNNYADMVNYLEPFFQNLGFGTERVVVPEEHVKAIPYPLEGPRVNLVATRDHHRGEPVTLYAHMDVVPIDALWTKDPFAGVVEEGKVYGRGALDMKSGIAGILVALEVMNDLQLEPHFDLICTLCTDEEVGVYPGVYHLAREGYVRGHVVNTELGTQLPLLIAGVAGAVDVTVRTVGRSCHSGLNFLGVNAVEAMVPILDELLELKAVVERRESSVPLIPLLRALGAPSDKVTAMFNVDVIRGGTKSNIVPGECEVVVNRRYLPEERYEEVVGEIQGAIERGKARSRALDVDTRVLHACYPFKADTGSKYAAKMRRALAAVHGYQESDIICAGAAASTDMGFVAQALNTNQFVGVGPATFDNQSAHQPDEWVRIDDLVNMTKQLVHYLAL